MNRSLHFNVGSSPEESIVRGAQDYSRSAGIHLPDLDYSHVVMAHQPSQAIAGAYERMPGYDPKALPAYRAMREETMRQYDHVTKPRAKGGLGIDIQVTKEDPYGKNSVHDVINEVRHDVQENRRIKVLSTASTGGHPAFTNDENDAFRGVHDLFGHLGSGRGVDMHGEEAAYQKHARMFSPLARQAMATETRGQNSYLQAHGEFPEQKVGLLPEHMQGLQFNRLAPAQEIAAAANAAVEENRKQRL